MQHRTGRRWTIRERGADIGNAKQITTPYFYRRPQRESDLNVSGSSIWARVSQGQVSKTYQAAVFVKCFLSDNLPFKVDLS
jgi:hypothetical protein